MARRCTCGHPLGTKQRLCGGHCCILKGTEGGTPRESASGDVTSQHASVTSHRATAKSAGERQAKWRAAHEKEHRKKHTVYMRRRREQERAMVKVAARARGLRTGSTPARAAAASVSDVEVFGS